MKLSHENKVEKFYSHGSDKRGFQEGGFLSFGYWIDNIKHYHEAVEALINRMLQFEKPIYSGKILNVACGYGAETLKIVEKIQPEKIVAIDITENHIAFAKEHNQSIDLDRPILYQKMDACKLSFEDNSFDYVIGIEGPAHFNTREVFLQNSFRVLKPNGVLLLSDIMVDSKATKKNRFNRIVSNFCAKHWHMPKANWMSIPELKLQLERIGFRVDTAESVGNKVYPGFSSYNLKWKSVINAVRIRGYRIGLALTFISWLLGYVHRRGLIDYVFIRAVKV